MSLLAYKPGCFLFYDDSVTLVFSDFRDGMLSNLELSEEDVADALTSATKHDMQVRALNVEESSLLSQARVILGAGGSNKRGMSLRNAGKPNKKEAQNKKGFINWLSDLLGDQEKKEEKAKLQDYLRKNYGKLGALTKQIQENEQLAQYLSKSLESGHLDPASLATMSELMRRDKSWLSKINLGGDLSPTARLVVPLRALDEYIKSSSYQMSSDSIAKEIKRNLAIHIKFEDAEVSVDERISKNDDGSGRVVTIEGDYDKLLATIKEFRIDSKDLLQKL